MEEHKKFSIIIPTYNCGQYLQKAIDSALNQEYPYKEIIVIDGNSTDTTVALLKSYGDKISWISEPDKGQADAINKGFSMAKGHIVSWLNADDYYEPNILREIADVFSMNNDAVLVYGNCKTVSKDKFEINIPPKHITAQELIDKGNLLYQPSSFYLLETVRNNSYLDDSLTYWMEYDLYIKLLQNGKGYYIDKILSNFTKREDQKSNPHNFPHMDKELLKISRKYGLSYFSKRSLSHMYTSAGLQKVKSILPSFVKTPVKHLLLYVSFLSDYRLFKKASHKDSRFSIHWHDRYPQLYDKTTGTDFDAHYLYHPAWAARIIAENNPEKHVDVSSILHFSTLVSAFVSVEFYDYRPANVTLSGLTCGSADLTNLFFADNSVQSLSCMHTIEHIGLGRYGDPIDPDGDLKAIAELVRVLAPGGSLLFVTPIGKSRIQFNAHRIYSYEQIMEYFSELQLQEFSLIPDNGTSVGIIKNATKALADIQRYGCGCFWFKKA
jgi:glycosyltransferase involved in cell wall biosynthesis